MRTVGQYLKDEREAKFYTLEEIEKATKIRKELLQALEEGNYAKLPPPTFIQGFIKNYGKFLGLDTERLLAIFRREFSERTNPPKIMDAWKNPLKTPKFRMTPTKLISGLVIGLISIFFIYLWFEYRSLAGPPPLEVSAPADQITVEESKIQVQGKTISEAEVAINSQKVLVDESGSFSQELELSDSVNKIEITAKSKFGSTARIERTVFLKQ
jgi:cytoskeletal protein RodZ